MSDTMTNKSIGVSLKMNQGTICFIDDNDPPDEVIIGACKFIIVLMQNYGKVPKDRITACLITIIDLFLVERQNE